MPIVAAKIEVIPKLPQPVNLTPVASAYLDAIRAMAAVAVMLGHLRGLFFVEYRRVDARHLTALVKAVFAVSAFGHQSVMVFFVLSGFFISSSILRNAAQGKWSWRNYAIDRAVRLYVVLVPGLVLGWLWDTLGLTFANGTGIYSAPLLPFGDNVPAQTLSLSSFVGNLLFLQTRFTPVFGSNSPLWSLFAEFWYYLLFPALLWTLFAARRRAVAAAVGYLLLAVAVIWILGHQAGAFAVWLSGCGIALASRYVRLGSGNGLAVAYSICAGAFFFLCLIRSHGADDWLGSDLAVGLSFAALLFGILQIHIPIGGPAMRMARAAAGFSYSLYVLHFPILMFVRAKWMPTLRWQPDAPHLALGAFIGCATLLYAYTVSRFTEYRTPAVRAWVRHKLQSRPPAES